jgi:hypothetical protein
MTSVTPVTAVTGITFPNLTKIVGRPTFATIKLLKKELFANSKVIHSMRGGGNLGHIGLLLSAVDYAVISNTPYNAPVHPGPSTPPPAGTTQAQITELNRQHDSLVDEFKLHTNVLNALRQQIILAVDSVYLAELEDDEMGLICTPLELLTHLTTVYATIRPDDIAANIKMLEAAWIPDPKIEVLWTRITTAKALAIKAEEPISDASAMRHITKVLEDTQVFAVALNNWRVKDEATKTLVNYKLHFAEENVERMRAATAASAGYNGAHATDTRPPPAPPPAPPVNVFGTDKPMYYCWTHGLSGNKDHTGYTCTRRDPGHIESAKMHDMKGGNNVIKGNGKRRNTPGRS